MMLMHFSSILAKGDEEWSKIIIGAIAVAIWVLHSLAQVFNKKKESERDNSPPPDYRSPEEIIRQQEEISRRLEEMARKPIPPQSRPVPAQARPVPPQSRPVPAQARPAHRTAQKMPKPPPKILVPIPPSVAAPAAIAPAVLQPARPAVVAASAVTLSRFLRPGTLRHQFILTEILQKPVALRPEHLDDL